LNPIKRVLAGLRKIGGLVLPIFADPGDFVGLGPGALWGLRLLALVLTLVVLAAINILSELHRFLEPPVGLDFLGSLWLPLLFLLIYVFCGLAWWLWSQFGPESDGATFPDIERAWREAVQSLERAGIGLNEMPLFLVLGRPQGPEGALFDGAELQLQVRGQPSREDSPLRVYASREAIFVTCPEASALGGQSTALESSEFEAPAPSAEEAEFMTFDVAGAALRGPDVAASILARARVAGRGPNQLLEEELRALGRIATERDESRGSEGPGVANRPSQARQKAAVELQEARLRHLARLIARDRRPYCPVNGILLLIPIAATNTEQGTTRVGLICRRDLAAIREAMQVRCPVFAMVCDLENLPGFRELIGRLPDDQRRRRMGQRFPLIPDIEPSALPGVFESGVQWIAHKQLPSRVDSLWRVEVGSELTMAEAVRGNVRLYQLLQQVRERHRRLGRLLSRAVLIDGLPAVMLGGCYLAGTGPDPRSQQAFLPGVFRRLIETQDFVAWTPETLAREASDNRKVRIGYCVLGVLTAVSAALVVYALAFANRGASP
jgi:IcmF-related N-terminal domain